MLRSICSVLMLTFAGCVVGASPALAQEDFTPPVPERALEPARTYTDSLERAGEAKVFRFDTTAPISVVQVVVKRTNTECELWGSLVDIDGTTLARGFLFPGATGTLTAIVATVGPVIVVLSDGPYASCAGATFEVTASVSSIDFTQPATSSASASIVAQMPADIFKCVCWSNRAEQLSTKIRRVRDRRDQSSGTARRRYQERLKSLLKNYVSATKQVKRLCV